MKYCCTESDRKGTCYHEFKKGKFSGFWKEDSILIHDYNLSILHLADIFYSVVATYMYMERQK